MRQFASQKRIAIWIAVAITIYIAVADWIVAPLHARGWCPTFFTYLNSLSAIVQFPGGYIAEIHSVAGKEKPSAAHEGR